MCRELHLLDLSNTAWSLASRACADEPLRASIAAQAIATLRGATPQTPLGNPAALSWALWRSGRQCWERAVFECFADLGVLVELVACGIVLTGNEWRRLWPVHVRIEQAMRVVCFWSESVDVTGAGISTGNENDLHMLGSH
mmetsp:Transcript_31465/g.86642  ORF Transcript_31465/g.86642 Transcript_31465/m.86642 type:complete len:141 (-) Transcript_31465:111-533(-)